MNSAYPPGWDKLYQKTVKSLQIGLFRADPAGNIVDADAGFVDLLRYPDLNSLLKHHAAGIWAHAEDQQKLSGFLNIGREVTRWPGYVPPVR